MIARLLAPLSAKIALGLGIVVFLLGIALQHEHSRADKNAQALATTKVAYETMQKAATAWATANKINADKANAANKEKADAQLDLAAASDRAGADAYARTHGVRSQAAICRGAGADLPGTTDPAPRADGPGEPAPVDGVVIARSAFDRCTEYTRRLLIGHDWALGIR